MTKTKTKPKTETNHPDAAETFRYVVVRGKIGRHYPGDLKVTRYARGDSIELTRAEALRYGEQVRRWYEGIEEDLEAEAAQEIR